MVSRLEWDIFAQFIAVLRVCVNVIPASQLGYIWLTDMPHTPAFAMLKIRHYHHQDRGQPRDGGRYPCNLISFLKEYEKTACRDPHDLIYALLGVANDIHLRVFERLTPNYNLSVEVVFTDVAKSYLYYTGDVRILHHVRNTKTLPHSFVPDWRVPNKTEQLAGYDDYSFKAGIGEPNQPPQVSLFSDGFPTVLVWYVDEINCSRSPPFAPGQGWDRVYPPQLVCWYIIV